MRTTTNSAHCVRLLLERRSFGECRCKTIFHFHPPLSKIRHWHAFHNAWATYIAEALNGLLPPDYFAEPNVQFGIEIDVAAFEEKEKQRVGSAETSPWALPAPTMTIPFQITTDIVEVAVYIDDDNLKLVGAVELVSPANKDRPQSRDEFVTKCAGYLRQGIGLIVVDIVTQYKSNLHDALVTRVSEIGTDSSSVDLYAAAYRPVEREEQKSLEIWLEGLTIAQALPTLPLWLAHGLYIPVDLHETYERTLEKLRIT
jgi:hypothetical protein